MRTAKHETMRSQNAAVLLQCLREFGPLTRHELQERTGLSWGAVSSIVNDFLSLGLLAEKPLQGSHTGRTPFSLDVNMQQNLLIGIDLHAQGISCVVTDMRARTLVSNRESVASDTRKGFLEQAMRMINQAIAQSGMDRSRFVGIGVSVQGAVDAANGISLHSPHLPEWNNVPVCEIMQKRFDLPAILVHDTNAIVLAEQWNGKARNVRNLIFIRLDMGLGMAMVVDNRIYTGADGTAGEFGHMVIHPDGRRCTCGNYGCMEAYASGRSILQKVREGVEAGQCDLRLTGAHLDRDLAQVAQAARDGSDFARGLFEDLGKYLGLGVSNLIFMLNPEMVVIGGDLAKYADLYMDRVLQVLEKNVWNDGRINLELSSLDTDAAAVGATLMLTRQVLSGQIVHPLGALFRSLSQKEPAGEKT